MKKIFCLLLSVLFIFSLFVFPVSADSSSTSIPLVYSKNSFALRSVKKKGSGSCSSSYYTLTFASNVWSVSLKESGYNKFFDYNDGDDSLGGLFGLAYLTMSIDKNQFSSLDLTNYYLSLSWQYDLPSAYPNYFNNAEFDYSLGTSVPEIVCVPCVDDLKGAGLESYSAYSNLFSVYGSMMYGEYHIYGQPLLDVLTDGSVELVLPFGWQAWSASYTVSLSLVPFSGSVPDEDEPGNDDIDFIEPPEYHYDYSLNIGGDRGVLSNYTVTDYYTVGSYSGFRDYSDYFVLTKDLLQYTGYSALLGIGCDYSTYEEHFVDSVCEQAVVTLPFTSSFQMDDIDLSLYKFRFEFICRPDSGFNYDSYVQTCAYLNSNYYGFEPFYLMIGNVKVPYDYFTLSFDDSNRSLKVTLLLDGAIQKDKYFMTQIWNSTSGNLEIGFMFYWFVDDGLLVGITDSGFWQAYSAPSVPIDPLPDTPSGGGFSQSDIDAAYDKGFNFGYNSGISDGSDKNYVFGFINGTFSAFNQFYKTVTSGISLGGVTLSAVITSAVIIGLLWIVIKKVI